MNCYLASFRPDRRDSETHRRPWLGALLTVALITVLTPVAAQAADGDIGYRDYTYVDSSIPTASKPQSKLWRTPDGEWWGSMLAQSGTHPDGTPNGEFHIFRLDRTTQAWVDTATRVDARPNTKQDTLWDGSHLYVASHPYTESTPSITGAGDSKLYRFSYDGTTKAYTKDAGFAVKINAYTTETLTIDKDSTGMLWATWVQDDQVYISHTVPATTTSTACPSLTAPCDLNWAVPAPIPAAGSAVTVDDISSVIHFGNDKIGVMWSNETNADVASGFYFAIHNDADTPDVWGASEAVFLGPHHGDDHINLTADPSGRVFAVVKTGLGSGTDPHIVVLDRATNGTWTDHLVNVGSDNTTRPIILEDPAEQMLYVFYTGPHPPNTTGENGGDIYRKSAPIGGSFEPGEGVVVIRDALDDNINNVTSTKQYVDASTGIVVLASDENTKTYWHADLPTVPRPLEDPVSALSADETAGNAPLAVTFDGSGSSDNRGITSWSLAFGDGTTDASGTGAPPASIPHIYDSLGAQTATLTVSDGDGLTDTDSVQIQVNGVAPVARLSADVTVGPPTLAVTFNGSTSSDDVGIATWSLAFGDGTANQTGTGTPTASILHSYTARGNYTATLTVVDGHGLSSNATVPIAVDSPPTARLTVTPMSGRKPLKTVFNGSASSDPDDGIASWRIVFGDGTVTSGTGIPPSKLKKTYAKVGTYQAVLTVTDRSGVSNSTAPVIVTVR